MPRTSAPSSDPKRQARRVVAALERLYPESRCALVHKGAYQLLVATVLSAQCTDVRVNLVTSALFARYPDAARLALSEPAELEALTALPGVGRKTANVVLGNAFEIASGVVVDTHVKRLAYRLGLTASRDPKVIERDLIALVPRKHWVDLSHRLIEHGRKVCIARKPRCGACALEPICPKVEVATKAGRGTVDRPA
jgi:endonuclease-3